MNWAGELCQKEIEATDTVLDLGCGIMQATLDTVPAYPPTKLNCKNIVGVDAYQPYLDALKGKENVTTLHYDIRQPLPFPDKSFDVCLLLDVLEHLGMNEVPKLLDQAERVTRKKIIILTPRNFRANEEAVSNAYELGHNPLQKHQCLISTEWLKQHGYKTQAISKPHDPYTYVFAVKTLRLRILHIWDQAGVAALTAKTQRENGHTAHCVLLADHDGLGISSHYKAETLKQKTYAHLKQLPKTKQTKAIYILLRKLTRNIRFIIKIHPRARDYDILHIHSIWYLLPLLPKKPRVLHFHGDDIRRKPSKYSNIGKIYKLLARLYIRTLAKREHILVSTPDLVTEAPNAQWLPNPVDTKFFLPSENAVYFHNWHEDKHHARKTAQEHGWSLTIIDRTENQHLRYDEMPHFLNQFTHFIDRTGIHSLSKTALEALSCGLKVVRWDGKIIEGLPRRHDPANVVRELDKIYWRVMAD